MAGKSGQFLAIQLIKFFFMSSRIALATIFKAIAFWNSIRYFLSHLPEKKLSVKWVLKISSQFIQIGNQSLCLTSRWLVNVHPFNRFVAVLLVQNLTIGEIDWMELNTDRVQPLGRLVSERHLSCIRSGWLIVFLWPILEIN